MILQKKNIIPRIAQWILELQNYAIEHRPGDKIKHINALSRLLNIKISVEDNSFEYNFSLCQSKNKKIKEQGTKTS